MGGLSRAGDVGCAPADKREVVPTHMSEGLATRAIKQVVGQVNEGAERGILVGEVGESVEVGDNDGG